jgi:tetratricopeptide (TPR) repeat protein
MIRRESLVYPSELHGIEEEAMSGFARWAQWVRYAVSRAWSRVFPTAERGGSRRFSLHVELSPGSVWEQVIPRWQKALVLEPTSARILNNLGIAYEQKGQYGLAEESYRKALALSPDDVCIRRNYELFRRALARRSLAT